MGRDALLAAILGGVLRPETSKEHSTHPGFGRAPVTLVDIRQGFGKNVARLVAGLEHVTCVEETAHAVLRGTGRNQEARDGNGITEEEEGEPLTPAMLIGVRERIPGEAGGGGVRGAKASSLREASALEQVGFSVYAHVCGSFPVWHDVFDSNVCVVLDRTGMNDK